MDFSALDDVALLGLIARGRSEALSVLYDRYGRLVYTIAIHVVGDAETAEEITQDVFVRAWESADTYRPDIAKVSSWLVSVTRHRAIDELRRRGARPEKDQVVWLEDPEMDGEGIEGMPFLDSPEGHVETTLEQRSIRQAISALPRDQQEVLGLAFFKGLSHSQIAETLGQPLGTVKSRIRLAMQKLRDGLIERGIVDG